MTGEPVAVEDSSRRFAAREVVQLQVARAVDDFKRGVERDTSFALIFTTYARSLERLFRCRGLDAEISRDLSLETLREVYDRLDDYPSHLRFEAWLHRIAVSKLTFDSEVAVGEEVDDVEALLAYLGGEVTPDEAEDIRARLAERPDREVCLCELEALMAAAPPSQQEVAATVARDLAAFQANRRIHRQPRTTVGTTRSRRVLSLAVVLALVGVAWLGRGLFGSRSAWVLPPSASVASSAALTQVQLLAGMPTAVDVAAGDWLDVVLVTRQTGPSCAVSVSRPAAGRTADDRVTLQDLEIVSAKVAMAIRTDTEGFHGLDLACGDSEAERYMLTTRFTGR